MSVGGKDKDLGPRVRVGAWLTGHRPEEGPKHPRAVLLPPSLPASVNPLLWAVQWSCLHILKRSVSLLVVLCLQGVS